MSAPESQRSRCYQAERDAFAVVPGTALRSLARVRSYVERVVSSEWWAARVGPHEARNDEAELQRELFGDATPVRSVLVEEKPDEWKG